MSLILCGFRGCGKTTLGRLLAEKLNLSFFDTDHWMNLRTGKSCSQIVKESGEAAFRNLEQKAIIQAGKERSQIIATGGGTLFHSNNAARLRMVGMLLYIDVPKNVLQARWQSHPPMLQDSFEELYKKRQPWYPVLAERKVSLTGENSLEAALEEIWEAIPLERFLLLQPGESRMAQQQGL